MSEYDVRVISVKTVRITADSEEQAEEMVFDFMDAIEFFDDAEVTDVYLVDESEAQADD